MTLLNNLIPLSWLYLRRTLQLKSSCIIFQITHKKKKNKKNRNKQNSNSEGMHKLLSWRVFLYPSSLSDDWLRKMIVYEICIARRGERTRRRIGAGMDAAWSGRGEGVLPALMTISFNIGLCGLSHVCHSPYQLRSNFCTINACSYIQRAKAITKIILLHWLQPVTCLDW